MNDYDPYEYYEEPTREQQAADRASTTLILIVFRLIYVCFRLFFLLLPSLLSAFWLLERIHKTFVKTDQWDYIWWLFGTVYVLECLVFFLKGWQQSLKQRGNILWLFIFIICLLYCFILPVCMFQVLIVGQFKRTPGTNLSRLEIIAWTSGAILGWLIYRRYSLGQDGAPWLFYWTYRIGRWL